VRRLSRSGNRGISLSEGGCLTTSRISAHSSSVKCVRVSAFNSRICFSASSPPMAASTSSTTRLLRSVHRNPSDGVDFRGRLGCGFWFFERFAFEETYSFVSTRYTAGRNQDVPRKRGFFQHGYRYWKGAGIGRKRIYLSRMWGSTEVSDPQSERAGGEMSWYMEGRGHGYGGWIEVSRPREQSRHGMDRHSIHAGIEDARVERSTRALSWRGWRVSGTCLHCLDARWE
jgi:hypothetical protein